MCIRDRRCPPLPGDLRRASLVRERSTTNDKLNFDVAQIECELAVASLRPALNYSARAPR
eukprot:10915081-Alexandrium_andersonii.AAC.1